MGSIALPTLSNIGDFGLKVVLQPLERLKWLD